MVVEELHKWVCKEDKKYKYDYRMIKNNVSIDIDGVSYEMEAYGIEIERQDFVINDILGMDKDYVKNISSCKNYVHNLLMFMYDNEVSPIHLVDILDEHFEEYILPINEKNLLCI